MDILYYLRGATVKECRASTCKSIKFGLCAPIFIEKTLKNYKILTKLAIDHQPYA